MFHYAIDFIEKYIVIPDIGIIDVVEILIITCIIYGILVWIKNTRAWTLLKGILVLGLFVLIATIFRMTTILWIANKTLSVGIMALIVIFQPEFRRALEQIGQKKFVSSLGLFDDAKNMSEKFSDRTIQEIVKASVELAKYKTGALIVIENNVGLLEYERTGISIDAEISSQLLINIFEHNTPLHDGAVIVRGDRICSATCYLPLSDNMELSKELGTRHRAGVGLTEVSDSLVIIVSEETGNISVAMNGELKRNISRGELEEELEIIQNKTVEPKRFRLWKGRKNNEKKAKSDK